MFDRLRIALERRLEKLLAGMSPLFDAARFAADFQTALVRMSRRIDS